MPKNNNIPKIIHPRILVLEGLWSDLDVIIPAAGGQFKEEAPWDYSGVEEELLSGEYHGLLLTGGSDISPNLYTTDPTHKECYGIDKLRDMVELRALEIAEKLGMPVLGICRGSQIMCAYKGGVLTQHIEQHRGGEHHVVAAKEAKSFKKACGSRDMRVISLHHQCVEEPGKDMRIAAFADDGTPEAIESKDGRWLGVQFHPEMNAFDNSNSFAIFQWLIAQAAHYAGGRPPHRPFRKMLSKRRAARKALNAANAQRAWADSQEIVEAGIARTTGTNGQTRISRKAGDTTQPSARELVRIIEEENGHERTSSWRNHPDVIATAEEIVYEHDNQELIVCSKCAVIFDDNRDMLDHEYFVHDIRH